MSHVTSMCSYPENMRIKSHQTSSMLWWPVSLLPRSKICSADENSWVKRKKKSKQAEVGPWVRGQCGLHSKTLSQKANEKTKLVCNSSPCLAFMRCSGAVPHPHCVWGHRMLSHLFMKPVQRFTSAIQGHSDIEARGPARNKAKTVVLCSHLKA
jgi:hypothetical protein